MGRYPGDVGDLIGEIAIWRVSRNCWCRDGKDLAMDSFHEGSENVWHSNAEMGLHRIDVWRCLLSPLRQGAVIDVLGAQASPHLNRYSDDWLSKRLKLSDLAKVVAQKAATSASKGVVISEGSETTSGEGSSVKRTLGETLGPQASVMASASTAEKILAGVILPADKEKVDRLTFDQVVTKFLHVLAQGVILGSSLAVRSRDFAECALNQKGALAEEKAKGKKLAEDANARDKVIARLEARISELEKSQPLSRKYPDLGVDLEDIEMDHEFLAKEEAEAEKRVAEEGAAGVEGVGKAVV
ncbi:hypothetical protein Acr_00g0030890 [Actinidia rufa]|uniref:Uncharacterized protein n=1 Tax=Actinidia rufa TaxID=165716 RepID=A0A7J0DEZ2_9ERIC|nr:hypothetical protein Acr_00g0030890 [Actinidia rufa]